MPHTIEKTAYFFDELDDSAKERARAWWRQAENEDFDSEYVIEDAQNMGALLGIEFKNKASQAHGRRNAP